LPSFSFFSFPAMIWADYMRQAVSSLPSTPLFTATPDQLSLHPLNQQTIDTTKSSVAALKRATSRK